MITLSRLFSRFTARGRREKKAQRWDRIADRAGAQRKLYAQAVATGTLTGAPPYACKHFRDRLKESVQAEQNARQRAAAIRRGER